MFKNQLRLLTRFGGQISPFYCKQHTAKHSLRCASLKNKHKKGEDDEI
jgi:hypothetical protein